MAYIYNQPPGSPPSETRNVLVMVGAIVLGLLGLCSCIDGILLAVFAYNANVEQFSVAENATFSVLFCVGPCVLLGLVLMGAGVLVWYLGRPR